MAGTMIAGIAIIAETGTTGAATAIAHPMATAPRAWRRSIMAAPRRGQYRQRWSRGERLPRGYNDYTAYNRIPYSYRQRYNLDPRRRYIYRDNMIYQVDPQTQIIQQIISGLVR